MAQADLPRFERARPTIEVGDLGAALVFLAEVVGMPVTVTQGEPPMFAMVGEGHAELALVEVDEPAIPEGAACYVTMDGLDALIERLAAAGIELAIPLTVRPWGQRDIVVRLPGEGPLVAFGEKVV